MGRLIVALVVAWLVIQVIAGIMDAIAAEYDW